MRKLHGLIAAGAITAAALGAVPGLTSISAAPHAAVHTTPAAHTGQPESIVGDKGKLARFVYGDGQPSIHLDAARLPARRSCSYTDWTGYESGPGGGVTVDMTYMSGCGEWIVKVECRNNDGSYVWRYSQTAYGADVRTAACYSDQYAITGGWKGYWNDRYHQVF